MARHVFQYDRMDRPLGLFLGDPYHLPPLPPLDEEIMGGTNFERPLRADEAGLGIYEQENLRRHTGAAHRQQEILAQQRQQVFRTQNNAAPVVVSATPVPAAGSTAHSNPVAVATPVHR